MARQVGRRASLTSYSCGPRSTDEGAPCLVQDSRAAWRSRHAAGTETWALFSVSSFLQGRPRSWAMA